MEGLFERARKWREASGWPGARPAGLPYNRPKRAANALAPPPRVFRPPPVGGQITGAFPPKIGPLGSEASGPGAEVFRNTRAQA
jgi:hypothetical protein